MRVLIPLIFLLEISSTTCVICFPRIAGIQGGTIAWIESHIELGQHPKVFHLCQFLEIDKPEAVGVLHLLWHFTMKFAWRDGDLKRFSPLAVADAIGWKKDAELLMRGLQECGWIDAEMKVHQWLEYAGKLVTDRLYKESRRKSSTKFDKVRQTAATLPYHTIPNQKIKDSSSNVENRLTLFEEFWKAYPRKVGKGAALRIWQKVVKPDLNLSKTIQASILAQKRSLAWSKDGGMFIPHPATWLNQQRWLDELPAGFSSVQAPADPAKLASRTAELLQLAERDRERRKQAIDLPNAFE